MLCTVVVNNWTLEASCSIKQSGQKTKSCVMLEPCINIMYGKIIWMCLHQINPSPGRYRSNQITAEVTTFFLVTCQIRQSDAESMLVLKLQLNWAITIYAPWNMGPWAGLPTLARGSTLYHICLCAALLRPGPLS